MLYTVCDIINFAHNTYRDLAVNTYYNLCVLNNTSFLIYMCTIVNNEIPYHL